MGIHLLPPLFKIVIAPPVIGPTIEHTVEFVPDKHPEVSSVDGFVKQEGTKMTWANLIAAAGNGSSDEAAGLLVQFVSYRFTTNWFQTLHRVIMLFDTSSIPLTAVITTASLKVYGSNKYDQLSSNLDMNIYSSNPASDTALVDADYQALGSTPLCDTPIDYTSFAVGDWNVFILNAAGLAVITKGGITKLGARNANYDVAGVQPPWLPGGHYTCGLYFEAADKLTPVNKPTLTVTYLAYT